MPADDRSPVRTMRAGMAGGMYPVPESVAADDTAEWLLRRSAELGFGALQVRGVPSDAGRRRAVKELAESLDVELEGSSRFIFAPLGTAPDAQLAELKQDIDAAKAVGITVLRSGYGRLTIETSRFDLTREPSEHKRHMVACLTEAARVAEDTGFPLAVENHCDFHGRELAEILAEVDSPYIGAALDTGNSFTVYCDPRDDIEALAPYTFTTHMKDMRVEQSPIRGTIPFLPRGCRLGEGHVDIDGAVSLLAEQSPRATGLHLLVESGWVRFPPDGDSAELRQDILEHGAQYLNKLIMAEGGAKSS